MNLTVTAHTIEAGDTAPPPLKPYRVKVKIRPRVARAAVEEGDVEHFEERPMIVRAASKEDAAIAAAWEVGVSFDTPPCKRKLSWAWVQDMTAAKISWWAAPRYLLRLP